LLLVLRFRVLQPRRILRNARQSEEKKG